MINKILTAIFIGTAIFATKTFSQDKQTLAIAPFTYVSGSISESDLKKVEASVEKVVNDLKRFQVVNREDMVAIDNEREKMKDDDFIDGRYIEQGRKFGAQLMIFGRVNSSVNRPQGKDNANNNIAIINFTIKIVDVTTTAEIATSTFEPNSGKNASQTTGATKSFTKVFDRVSGSNTNSLANSTSDIIARTPEQAMSKAIDNVEEELRPFLIETFPVMFSIAEILEKKDDKAKSVLILGGKEAGLQKGDKLTVIEQKEIEVEGKKHIRNVPVAELIITEVEDNTFSRCNVITKGEELTKKFESKAKIKAVTQAKTTKKLQH